MTYAEKRRAFVATRAYRKDVTFLRILFVLSAIAYCILLSVQHRQSGFVWAASFQGGPTGFYLFSLGYWVCS